MSNDAPKGKAIMLALPTKLRKEVEYAATQLGVTPQAVIREMVRSAILFNRLHAHDKSVKIGANGPSSVPPTLPRDLWTIPVTWPLGADAPQYDNSLTVIITTNGDKDENERNSE